MMNQKKAVKTATELANKLIRILRTDDFRESKKEDDYLAMNLSLTLYDTLKKLLSIVIQGSGIELSDDELETLLENYTEMDLPNGEEYYG